MQLSAIFVSIAALATAAFASPVSGVGPRVPYPLSLND